MTSSWSPRKSHSTPRGASKEPDYGLGYWATFPVSRPPDPPAKTWQGAWFEWGLRNTGEFDYIEPEDLRGSFAFHAGVTFESKASPSKKAGNGQ